MNNIFNISVVFVLCFGGTYGVWMWGEQMREQKVEVMIPAFLGSHVFIGMIVGLAFPKQFALATIAYFLGGLAFLLGMFPFELFAIAFSLPLIGTGLAHVSLFYFGGWFLGRHVGPISAK